MAPAWNFADVWETVAETVSDVIAQVNVDCRCDGTRLQRRAYGIGTGLEVWRARLEDTATPEGSVEE